MGSNKLAGNVVEQWLQHCRGKRTVVFAVNVAHSMQLVERFRAAGVVAEHVDGESPIPEREGVLRRLARGETQVVCNVNVLTEGWDCPELEVVVLARPTLSVGFYMQMVGRGLRPAFGKSICRIHDHAGCILRHGLPDADRDYSLTADGRRGGPKELVESLRRCLACFALYDAALRACPQCGREHVGKPRVVREDHNATAVPIEQIASEEARRGAYLDRLLLEAELKGKKRGWAAYKYKERYGEWPPTRFWAGGMKKLDGEKLQQLQAKMREFFGGAK
jgi:DNA repair protein RadD